MKKIRFGFLAFVSLSLMVAFMAPYSFAIESSLENAVLTGDWKGVIEILEKDDKEADDPVARLLMGHACLAINRNNQSLLLFLSVKEENELKSYLSWTESLVSSHSENSISHYLLGDAYARLGRLDDSLKEFNESLRINPRLALALNARGAIHALKGKAAYLDKGEYELAIFDYNKAIEINPRYAEAYNNRGLVYDEKGQYDQAISDYNKAIEIDPRDAKAYNNKALACEKVGRIKEAVEAYRGFIKYAPPGYAPYINFATQKIRELVR